MHYKPTIGKIILGVVVYVVAYSFTVATCNVTRCIPTKECTPSYCESNLLIYLIPLAISMFFYFVHSYSQGREVKKLK